VIDTDHMVLPREVNQGSCEGGGTRNLFLPNGGGNVTLGQVLRVLGGASSKAWLWMRG
jgi:hypothetical protein